MYITIKELNVIKNAIEHGFYVDDCTDIYEAY